MSQDFAQDIRDWADNIADGYVGVDDIDDDVFISFLAFMEREDAELAPEIASYRQAIESGSMTPADIDDEVFITWVTEIVG